MALTEKKKAFAQSKHDGADNKQAAIFAGYSPESASQAGSRLAKDPDVIAHIERLKINTEVKPEIKPEQRPIITKKDIETAGNRADPLEFLISIFSDPVEDMKLRLDAAKAALPYVHGKVAEKGKKESKADAAKTATQGGKFGTLGSQLKPS